jgi:hypothetical protein
MDRASAVDGQNCASSRKTSQSSVRLAPPPPERLGHAGREELPRLHLREVLGDELLREILPGRALGEAGAQLAYDLDEAARGLLCDHDSPPLRYAGTLLPNDGAADPRANAAARIRDAIAEVRGKIAGPVPSRSFTSGHPVRQHGRMPTRRTPGSAQPGADR